MSLANLPKRKFDVVIVGAGGSGMRASLQLARAGLNVDEGIHGIHLAGEHALEFELFDAQGDCRDIRFNARDDILIRFHFAEFEHLAGILETRVELDNTLDHALKLRAFLA